MRQLSQAPRPGLPQITLPYKCGAVETNIIWNKYLVHKPVSAYWLVTVIHNQIIS